MSALPVSKPENISNFSTWIRSTLLPPSSPAAFCSVIGMVRASAR